MNYLAEQVAYIKGLMDGLNIGENTDEGKILSHIVNILNDIVYEISDINDSQIELDEYVQILDEDLSIAENQLFENEDYHDTFEDPRFIEVECPHCHETVYFSSKLFDEEDELSCPNCDAVIYDEDESIIDVN